MRAGLGFATTIRADFTLPLADPLCLSVSLFTQELSIYKMMDQNGLSNVAEKDREDHQQVKQAMAGIDSNGISTVGLDEYCKRVVEACQLFLHHAEVRT